MSTTETPAAPALPPAAPSTAALVIPVLYAPKGDAPHNAFWRGIQFIKGAVSHVLHIDHADAAGANPDFVVGRENILKAFDAEAEAIKDKFDADMEKLNAEQEKIWSDFKIRLADAKDKIRASVTPATGVATQAATPMQPPAGASATAPAPEQAPPPPAPPEQQANPSEPPQSPDPAPATAPAATESDETDAPPSQSAAEPPVA